ncbi:uncharacterized protein BKA78DRAFT_357178 [Phyllosticta capitalensis]|uniref:uncharacterized protein n=1 Tax=Phyllosticta capitalensis TaxID=121624 RepID=UPI003130690C
MANKKRKSGNNTTKAANKTKSAKHANDLSSQEFEAQLREASGKKEFKSVVQVQEKEIETTKNGVEDGIKKKESPEPDFELERLFVTFDGEGLPVAARTTAGPAMIIKHVPSPTLREPHRVVPRFQYTIPDDAAGSELFPLMVHVGQGLMDPENLPGRMKQEGQDWADWDTLLHEARVGCDVLWYEWVHAYTTPFEPPFVVCEGWRAQRILDCTAFEDPELDRFFSAGGANKSNNEEDDGDMEDGEVVDEDDDDSLSDVSSTLSDAGSDAGSEWSDIVDKIDNDMLERMLATAREAGKYEVDIAGATPLPPLQEPQHPANGNGNHLRSDPGTRFGDGVFRFLRDLGYDCTDIADNDIENQMRAQTPNDRPTMYEQSRRRRKKANEGARARGFPGCDENEGLDAETMHRKRMAAQAFRWAEEDVRRFRDQEPCFPSAVNSNMYLRGGGVGRSWQVERQSQGFVLGEVEDEDEWEDVEG